MENLFREIDLMERDLKVLEETDPNNPLYILNSGVVCVRAMRVVNAAKKAKNATLSNKKDRIMTDG